MKDPRVVAAVLGGGVGYWLYTQLQPGASVVSALQEVQRLFGTVTLSPEQERIVTIIASEAAAAGLSWLTVAAVVNAYAESRLNPMAIGDNGASVGLFQLHEKGAGKGMTVAQRQDPAQNAARIFDTARGTPVAGMRGKSNAELVREFAHHVERCYECGHAGGSGQLDARELLLVDLYGASVAASRP